MVLWFYVQEHPKAQPAVVLILKRLRRHGNGLKSHPTGCRRQKFSYTSPSPPLLVVSSVL